MKRAVLLFFLLFGILSAEAQFVQQGVALEYSPAKLRSPFKYPVSINVAGASPQVSSPEGLFSLSFNHLAAGSIMPSLHVETGNKQYLWFNKDKTAGWVLTPDLRLELLFCNKDVIDYLATTYSDNYVRQLEKRYQKLRNELERSSSSVEQLQKEKEQLEQRYQAELTSIRARAIQFAYVDESELDSLELEMRRAVLSNDLTRAYEIGEAMNLRETASSTIGNLHKALKAVKKSADECYRTCTTLEQHLVSCKAIEADQMELQGYYESLINLYRELVDVYETELHQEESFVRQLKRRLGDAIMGEFLDCSNILGDSVRHVMLREAAQLDNLEAIHLLPHWDKYDYERTRSLYEHALAIPDITDSLYLKYIRDELKTFPDFLYVSKKGDSLFCHILSEDKHEVAICDFHNARRKYCEEYEVPSTVFNGHTRYTVVEIGEHAYQNGWCHTWEHYPCGHSSDSFLDRSFYRKLTIPESIQTIAAYAFDELDSLKEIVFSKGLKTIGDDSFGYSYHYSQKERRSLTFTLPEGLDSIGMAAFYLYNNKQMRLYLPGSLRGISYLSFGRTEFGVKEFDVSPDNPFLFTANKCLYNDKGEIIAKAKGAKKLETYAINDRMSLNGINDFRELKWVDVSPSHPLYAGYEGLVMSKDMKTCLYVPENIQNLAFPPTLECLPNKMRWYSTGRITIPRQMKPDLVFSIIAAATAPERMNHRVFLEGDSVALDSASAASALAGIAPHTSQRLLHFWGNFYAQTRRHHDLGMALLGQAGETLSADSAIYRAMAADMSYYSSRTDMFTEVLNEDTASNALPMIAYKWGKSAANAYDPRWEDIIPCMLYAADNGYAPAEKYVADMYAEGAHLPLDTAAATHWYERAYAHGIPDAAIEAGLMHFNGANYEQAYHYFQAEKTKPVAILYLGRMYQRGLYVEQDSLKAFSLYKQVERNNVFPDSSHEGLSDKYKQMLYFFLGEMYYLSGESVFARYDLNLSTEHGSDKRMKAQAYYYMACIELKENDMEWASQYIQEALKRCPDNQEYKALWEEVRSRK